MSVDEGDRVFAWGFQEFWVITLPVGLVAVWLLGPVIRRATGDRRARRLRELSAAQWVFMVLSVVSVTSLAVTSTFAPRWGGNPPDGAATLVYALSLIGAASIPVLLVVTGGFMTVRLRFGLLLSAAFAAVLVVAAYPVLVSRGGVPWGGRLALITATLDVAAEPVIRSLGCLWIGAAAHLLWSKRQSMRAGTIEQAHRAVRQKVD
jgi:hypothetical protein